MFMGENLLKSPRVGKPGRTGRTIAAATLFATVQKQGLRTAKRVKKALPAAGDALLARIAAALERLAPPAVQSKAPAAGDAFVWEPALGGLVPVAHVTGIALDLLKGIEAQRDTLMANTKRFADGLPANNALLWGARGMGKSSLVKAVHEEINRGRKGLGRLALIEVHREDIATLPQLLRILRDTKRQFLLYCDDLSFDKDDTSYKSLKAALEGGIEGRPGNVLFYATSNRRHLMPRDLVDNERGTAINPGEAVEEKVSLSDRFGLWLGFHNCSQDDYLAMLEAYRAAYKLAVTPEDLRGRGLAWAMGRGSRSGRVAWQFIQDLAGELGQKIEP
jgi:predicted AAA+ superfamily ATPase